MFNRLVIVFMLMVLPLQWSLAQEHELGDDAGVFALAAGAGAAPEITALLTHNDEPGGACQFHQLAQPSVDATALETVAFPARPCERWTLALQVNPMGSQSPGTIEKPKWSSRPQSAANS